MLFLRQLQPVAAILLGASNVLAGGECSLPKLYDASLEELTIGLDRGCFTSAELVRTYQARIEQVNSQLRAVYEVNPDALGIATALDAEHASGSKRGLLHGIPILLKDNIATADKMGNTAGSYALVGAKVSEESTVAAKLRDAGAIILGKTNLGEWAQYRSLNTTSGWSAVGGQSYGPHWPQMDPYGSSTGSAVGTAVGLAFAALGTETHGSIVMPANRAFCVGIKPTVGLTSRHMVIPVSEHRDSIGPNAHSVRDAAALLSVIAGMDPKDNYTSAIPGSLPDYLAVASADLSSLDLTGVRIGIPRNGISAQLVSAPVNETHLLAAFDKAIAVLKDLGAEVIDHTNFSDAVWNAYVTNPSNELLTTTTDFINGLQSYMSSLTINSNNITTLQDLRNFTINHPLEGYPDRDVGIWDLALSFDVTPAERATLAYEAHQNNLRLDAEGGITGVIDKFDLSALIIPTEYAPSWSSAPGLPTITVPMGVYPPDTPVIKGPRELIAVAPGIPFGLTFFGKRWSEETLIRLAYAFEQKTLYRKNIEPGAVAVLPTIELEDMLVKSRG